MTQQWFDEIDLDPTSEPVSMGIRALGDRPWLLPDDRRDDELLLKAELARDRPDEVFQSEPGAEPAAELVIGLLEAAGVTVEPAADLHPLDRAGRSVQEDLCLMRRDPAGWHLAAASLSFPSRWRLAAKMGAHITDVHGPVRDYEDRLATRVDTYFDRLTASPTWRRNWFVHPDPALFQPDRPAEGDPAVPADRALDELFLRSERQTLRRLDPLEDWVLFTIKVQQSALGEFLAAAARREAFRSYLRAAPSTILAHRGMGPDQVEELQRALRAR